MAKMLISKIAQDQGFDRNALNISDRYVPPLIWNLVSQFINHKPRSEWGQIITMVGTPALYVPWKSIISITINESNEFQSIMKYHDRNKISAVSGYYLIFYKQEALKLYLQNSFVFCILKSLWEWINFNWILDAL